MLSNYQMREQGGEGYMRLLEFLPDGSTVNVFTYSPLYDKFLDEEGSELHHRARSKVVVTTPGPGRRAAA
jgi:hypothetical protein